MVYDLSFLYVPLVLEDDELGLVVLQTAKILGALFNMSRI